MRTLLHTCCAPCLVHPFADLSGDDHDVTAFFYNPNIHPHAEYLRRLDAFTTYTADNSIPAIVETDPDGLTRWLRAVVFREPHRCSLCFTLRLERTAELARDRGFDAFSTTLLYSRFQRHDLLKEVAEAVSDRYSIPLAYRDWRTGWNQGVKIYRKTGLYRQKYCGCIFSEKERAEKLLAS